MTVVKGTRNKETTAKEINTAPNLEGARFWFVLCLRTVSILLKGMITNSLTDKYLSVDSH
jgi:hypothetical protein